MGTRPPLTGEAEPVRKSTGAVVYAGTVVEEGQLVMTVEQQAGNGRYDQIVQMIEASEKLKSSSETRAAAPGRQAGALQPAGHRRYLRTDPQHHPRHLDPDGRLFPARRSCPCRWRCFLLCVSAAATTSPSRAASIWKPWPRPTPLSSTRPGTLTHATPTVVDVVPFGGRNADDVRALPPA